LIQIKVPAIAALHFDFMEWKPIFTAPFDRELELAVIDRDGPHALAFACRRADSGWIDAKTRLVIEVNPTHWREWHAKS
jgi:hypothetical protein